MRAAASQSGGPLSSFGQLAGGVQPHFAKGEIACKAVLDMDAGIVTLAIKGVTHTERFSETVPNVSYIGCATQSAGTLFTDREMTL